MNFAHATFHWTFIALALINLSCQLLINQLEINDGHSLLNKARE